MSKSMLILGFPGWKVIIDLSTTINNLTSLQKSTVENVVEKEVIRNRKKQPLSPVSGQFPPRQLPPGQLPPANSPRDNSPPPKQ